MKKALLIAALILLALFVVVVLVLLLANHQVPRGSSQGPNGQQGGSPFPVSSTTSLGTGVPTTKVKDAQGDTITTNDFIDNGQTIPDPTNPGNYQLAGDLNVCPQNTKCTAAPVPDQSYSIGYNSSENAFTIALLKEPLATSRSNAETFLMKELGLTKDQMCKLNYYVGTPYWVNEQYDSDNLGFSFCPGATKLP